MQFMNLFSRLSVLLGLSVSAEESRPWAVVTGASSGIGAAIARETASRGYNTILVARRAPQLNALAKELHVNHNTESVVVPTDLADDAGCETLVSIAAAHSPQLLVLNAGVCRGDKFALQSSQHVHSMLQLNVASTTYLLRRFGASFAARGSGRVLIIASSAGAAPGVPGVAVYAATKAYLRSLAAGVGSELRHAGVHVTCALPSAVDSEFSSASGLERAAIFTLPGVRSVGGIVLSSEAVAKCALDACLRGRREIVPGLAPRLYVGMTDRRLLPTSLSRALAAFSFATSPWSA